MKTIKRILSFVVCSVVISHISFAQKSIDSLITKLNRVIQKENIPGAMISIVKSDSIIFTGGIGYANIEKEEPVTKDHLFRLGSISKSFTALGIVKLVAENKLNLSMTVNEIDSTIGIKNIWKKDSYITIEQVLEHTAGFEDLRGHAKYADDDIDSLTCKEMLHAHRRSLYPRWKPGVRKAYSNPGYVLAGYIMEKISKKSYHQYIKNDILIPIGMINSGFYFKKTSEMIIANGYHREGGKLSPIEFKSVQGGPASDFCSNAAEMSLFLKFMLSRKSPKTDKALIDSKWFDRIENPETSISAKNGFKGGYGLGNVSIWTNNHLFHGHDGGIDGFSSMYLYSQEANFGLAVSMNRQGRIWKLVDEILDFYVEKNTYSNTESIEINNDIRNKYSGFYNFKNPRNQKMHFIQKTMSGHSIEFMGNRLLIKDFGGEIRDTLYHKGKNQYFRETEGVPFAMLLENDDKHPVLWLGGDYAEKGNKSVRIAKNYLLLGSLIMSVLYLFVGFIWWVRQLSSTEKKSKKDRFILWLSSLCLVFTMVSFIITTEVYEKPESINLGSILVFLGSIAFFVCSGISIITSLKLSEEGMVFKWYYRLTAISLLVIALWLLLNNFIGFKLWVN